MKESKSTLVLLGATLVLFSYILIFERQPSGTTAREQPAEPLFPNLNPDRVSRLVVTRTNATIQAQRKGGLWTLQDPAYPAQSALVTQWLESLSRLTRQAHLTARDVQEQPGGLAAFGLEPPLATVLVEQGSDRTEFQLGNRTPMGKKMYVMVLGGNGVSVTESEPLDQLPVSVSQWRDPRLIRLTGVAFDRVSIRSGSRELELERVPGERRWRVTRPRSARADTGRVEQMLHVLQTAQITAFVDDFPTADLEPYGLQEPELVFSIASGTNQLFNLDLGRSPPDLPQLIFARRSDHAGVVAVPREVLSLLAVPYAHYLDYQLLEFPVSETMRVEVQAKDDFVLERQTNATWRVTGTDTYPADPALVRSFLDQLRSLQIVDVAKEVVTELDLPSYGLKPPTRRYGVEWVAAPEISTNRASLQIELGTNRADRIFARRLDENSVYAISYPDSLLLPEAAFKLRDRRLWSFTTNQVTQVTINHRDQTYVLLRRSSGEWSIAEGSQGIVNTFALEEAVARLGALWARAWIGEGEDQLADYGIPQVNHRLSLEVDVGGQTVVHSVAFGATSPSGGPFASIAFDSVPTVFEFPLEIFHPYREVLKSLEALNATTP